MNNSVKNKVIPYLQLTKPIITLSVAFSSLTGYILFAGGFTPGWLQMYFGVLFIAAGSSAINQIQEHSLDQKMERTRERPLPSGRISRSAAMVWAFLLVLAGGGLLWASFHLTPVILAFFTLIWYNGVYTPLKQVTPWAIIPGALVGAIPPAIGWTAAGGTLYHSHIIFLSFFFFIGQIPHFWLILLRYGEDYAQAGFPSISRSFNKVQITRLTFTWTFATAIIAVFMPLFGIITTTWISLLIIALSLLLTGFFYTLPGMGREKNINKAFMVMNIYFLFMMILIIMEGLTR